MNAIGILIKMLVTGLLWFLLLMFPTSNPQHNVTNVSYLRIYSMFSYLLNYWSRVFHDLEELGEKLDLSRYKGVGDRWGLLGESFRFGKVIYLLLLLLLLFYFILFHIFFWVGLIKKEFCMLLFLCVCFCVIGVGGIWMDFARNLHFAIQ